VPSGPIDMIDHERLSKYEGLRMTIITFPSRMPTPQQLDLPRAELSLLLHELVTELIQYQSDLMMAQSAPEFAAAVRKTTDKLAEASAGWTQMSTIIREEWGL
jgi:hypothetical protein